MVLKEEQPIAGRSLRLGSLLTEGWVSEETHPVAERVLAAGAIVHARTTTPEFSCAAFTHSDLWGITRNPWNPDFGPGGSSGGSGAALASGRRTSPRARTSAAPSASPRRSTASSASSRPTAACPRWHRSTSTPTATTARWAAPSPTSPCSRT